MHDEEGAYWHSNRSMGLPSLPRFAEDITPFANDAMNLALRRHTIPLPSETNDATTPSVRRIRAHESRGRYAPRLMRAGIGPCHIARAIDPASSDFSRETILPWARRATTLFPVDHASHGRACAHRLEDLAAHAFGRRVAGGRVTRTLATARAATFALASLSPLCALTTTP
jgi:hypothetical protein